MIFCNNKEESDITDSSLLDSLFSLTSDDQYRNLHASTSMPSSLANFLFISEVLTERVPEVNWQRFLRDEINNVLREEEDSDIL
jgi:hypothetical protein